MTILGTTLPSAFIAAHWQQKPLLVRGALGHADALIDGDDLAGIACEPDGDARLVFADNGHWRAEHGPFDETVFAQLPTHSWTLLVQAVDQWIPEVGELLREFGFLPRWRLDDIMVSYAADGGGVGPHFDYYDVFLLQACGQRAWQIGQRCDAQSPLRDNPDMKLLRDFNETGHHTVSPGDMLYLPAGIAHWGTAIGDDCITISIGFRAPSKNELLEACGEEPCAEDDIRYRDTPASIDPDPWRINTAAVDNLLALCAPLTLPRDTVLRAFGSLVTEPRYPERIASEAALPAAELTALLGAGQPLALEHHPASRFAYYSDSTQTLLFVDGEPHRSTHAVARGICHGQLSNVSDDEHGLLLQLLKQGSVLIEAWQARR
ncbi:MAG TPA: cupin domain-containing protein [Pseudomonadales bacterium]